MVMVKRTAIVLYIYLYHSGIAVLSLQMDGITNTYSTPYLIDLVNKGSSLIPDFWIPIPERFLVPNTREHLFVSGSQRATINVAGTCCAHSLSTRLSQSLPATSAAASFCRC